MGETKRWVVTYTKHIHQKRKVYQDGILELNVSRNKVMLYDDTEKLLDTRFLRKDEVIECGGTFAFDCHIVDIGDQEEKPKSLSNASEIDGIEKSENRRSVLQNGAHLNLPSAKQKYTPGTKRMALHNKECAGDRSNTTQTNVKEWTALYTTQLTQKAKKFHDGILQLIECGSHMHQVILLSEDRNLLSSKYLKSADFLKTGIAYELPNYLIQICEPWSSHRVELEKNGSSKNTASSSSKTSTIMRADRRHKDEPLHDGKSNRKEILPEEPAIASCSQLSRILSNETVSVKKPVRDAFQILLNLQKAESSHNPQQASVGEARSNELASDEDVRSKMLDLNSSDIRSSKALNKASCKFVIQDVQETDSLENAYMENDCFKSEISRNLTLSSTIPINSKHWEEVKLDSSLASSNFSTGLLHLSASKLDANFSTSADADREPLITGSKFPGICSLSKNDQIQCVDRGDTEDGPGSDSVQMFSDAKDEFSNQVNAGMPTNGEKGVSLIPLMDIKEFSKTSKKKQETCPSFDLGIW